MQMEEDYSVIQLEKLTTTAQDCMNLLPASKTTPQQSIMVGDSEGYVNSFTVKKGVVKNNYRTQLLENKPVQSIQVSQEKAFMTAGNVVFGVNKSGKVFYRMDTNMTESISHMRLNVPHLWSVGEYVMYLYQETEEKGFFMSPDRINCIEVENVTNGPYMDAVLGCQDRVLRVVNCQDIIMEVVLNGGITYLANYNQTEPPKEQKEMLFGLSSGQLGKLTMHPKGAKKEWSIDGNSPITAIASKDMSKTGVEDIIVGRDDGTIQVYGFDEAGIPLKKFERNVGESITSLKVGFVTNTDFDDIISTTFSGKVLAFSNEKQLIENKTFSKLVTNSSTNNKFFDATGAKNKELQVMGMSPRSKIENAKKYIEQIEEKIAQTKAAYAKMTTEMIAVYSKYNVKTSFSLDPKKSCYRAVFELDVPIETIALHCDINIDYVDSEVPNVIIAHTQDKKTNSSSIVVRSSESTNRIEISIRTIEGKSGTLEAFIVPSVKPKTSVVKTFAIRPLSLHQRKYVQPEGNSTVSNSLTITGNFSLTQIHSWISLCVDDIPEKITTDDELSYYYESTFIGTFLTIKCKKGEALFFSDNASTLSTIEEKISKIATEQQMHVKIEHDLKAETFTRVIKKIFPKIEHQLQLTEKCKLVEPLRELQMSEENIEFLSEDCKQVLINSVALEEEQKQQTQRLDFLFDILRKLYQDKWKFKVVVGQGSGSSSGSQHSGSGKPNPSEFEEMLKEPKLQLETVINFFKNF